MDVAIRRKLVAAERSFDLDVAFSSDSRRIVLHGPSGSGKSMTLRAIAGLMTPDAGRIVVNDRVLFDAVAGTNLEPQARQLGFLFQDYALFPHLNVMQNVAFGLVSGVFNARRGARDERVLAMLAAFELDHVARSFPSQLSGGQRQRVALARALVTAPALLLLDEPFAALDARLRVRMREELLALQQRLGLNLLMITHDPADVEALGEHVLDIRDGRIV